MPKRNTGISCFNTCAGGRVSYAVGAFANTDDFANGSLDSNGAVTARVTAAPVLDDGGRRVIHVGASYSHRSNLDDMLRYRARPEVHTADRFVDTASFESDGVDLYGVEAAAVLGPLSLQSEYVRADARGDGATRGDPSFEGFYVFGSLFLTGEHRPYRNGVFNRVDPIRNAFSDGGGTGALELVARYSTIDLDDAGIRGGEMDDSTLGLNWYLNPNLRLMLNYIRADVDSSGDADALLLRATIFF